MSQLDSQDSDVLLDGWLSSVRRVESPNFDARPDGCAISLIVVHAISLPPAQFGSDDIVRLFTNCLQPKAHPYFFEIRALRVSAHFLIRRDGSMIQFVSCRQRAWHAGASSWKGRGFGATIFDRHWSRVVMICHLKMRSTRGGQSDQGIARELSDF